MPKFFISKVFKPRSSHLHWLTVYSAAALRPCVVLRTLNPTGLLLFSQYRCCLQHCLFHCVLHVPHGHLYAGLWERLRTFCPLYSSAPVIAGTLLLAPQGRGASFLKQKLLRPLSLDCMSVDVMTWAAQGWGPRAWVWC